MFAQLLASQSVRQRSAAGVATSVTLHVFLVAFALYATVGTAAPVVTPPESIMPWVPPEPVEPTPTPPVAHTDPSVPGVPTIDVPIEVPISLPLISATLPTSGTELLPGTRFVVGTPNAPVTTPTDPRLLYVADQVESVVALEKNSPVPRFPVALKAAGIEGEARFRFVVDTLGRVEMATVERLSATRDAFAIAVREVLPRMRFRPASIDGRPVRQLVEFPIVFRVRR